MASNEHASVRREVGRATRQNFFFSVLLATLASTPLAFGIVAWHWAQMASQTANVDPSAAALVLVRMFLASFDMLVLVAWLPCAIVTRRLTARLRPKAIL